MVFKRKEDVRPQPDVRSQRNMSASFWSIWNTTAQLGLARPTTAEFALLVVLGASLLALRAFRETYLKIWVLGWTVFAASRLAEHCFAAKIPAPFDQVAVQATFVLAAGLVGGSCAGLCAHSRPHSSANGDHAHSGGLRGSPSSAVARFSSACAWPSRSATASFCSPLRLLCCALAADDGSPQHGCWLCACHFFISRGRRLLTACLRLHFWPRKLRLASACCSLLLTNRGCARAAFVRRRPLRRASPALSNTATLCRRQSKNCST